MKRLVIVAAIFLLAGGTAGAQAHAGSFGVFYSSLGLHGEWILVDHDVYAWKPYRVARAWRPYWDGRWIWTDDGWYWVSDEPWAWAVYHYGRWYYDDYYGWLWMPGYEWAPAWVEWRCGPDYVGWAPLGPYAVFSINVGITYPTVWVTPYSYWTFVPCHAMGYAGVCRYAYPREANPRWFGATRSMGSVAYEMGRTVVRGPEPSFIERHGGVRVQRTTVVAVEEHGRDRIVRDIGIDRIEVYRPRIDRTEARPERYRRSERLIDIQSDRIDGRYAMPAPDRGQARDRSDGVEEGQRGNRDREIRIETNARPERGSPSIGVGQAVRRAMKVELPKSSGDRGRGDAVQSGRRVDARTERQQAIVKKQDDLRERAVAEREPRRGERKKER